MYGVGGWNRYGNMNLVTKKSRGSSKAGTLTLSVCRFLIPVLFGEVGRQCVMQHSRLSPGQLLPHRCHASDDYLRRNARQNVSLTDTMFRFIKKNYKILSENG